MDITAIHKELRALLMLVERWSQQGYTPTVERDIALGRIRTLYDTLLETDTISDELPEFSDQKTTHIIDILSGRVVEPDEQEQDEEDDDEVAHEQEQEVEAQQEEEEPQEQEVEAQQEQDEKAEDIEDDQQKRRFIHDLFCNDETFYDQEMAKLSALEAMDDVLIYIGEKYAWVPESQSAQEFVELQYKRFSSL